MKVHVAAILILIAAVIASCKREKPRPAPEDGRASAPVPATTPFSQPASCPADDSLTESQLLQFIAGSRKIVPEFRRVGHMLRPSPDAFHELAAVVRQNPSLAASIARAGIPCEQWLSIGNHAWSAWSVAQRDYNAEAPLRENAKNLSEARNTFAQAQATLKNGVREMSADERVKRIAAAHDAATNAGDRAELWAQKASDLRERIAVAAGFDATPGVGEPPEIAASRAQAQAGARAAQAAMAQDLAVAERNERQARDDAKRSEEAALHPELALDQTDKSELMQHARETTERAKTEILRCEQNEKLLRARLADDRRVNLAERNKVACESDIALLRKHLTAFNDAWGMTVEGSIKKSDGK